ncbi:riboflavin synthase [Brevibacillus sp. H7]|uniref:riboflavin synthase n=1 Tax=Brevibacillus sp. H7 TaxID=3349138 RepID=UPI00381FDF75
MFTGIVEELGVLENVTGNSVASKLLIKADKVLKGVQLGDSIAVNGVCLTVTSFSSAHFTADVMPETMKKTNLGRLKRGETINLERAMRLGDRFGGHIVSGHVDGTGEIVSREPHANAVLFRIKAGADLLKYMVPRGSVAVDGISLTLVDVTAAGFTISIIPHTLSHTNMQGKHPGDLVNLECDVIGKYVERLMGWKTTEQHPSEATGLTMEVLRENGFL